MLGRDCANRLQLDDDPLEANKVRDVGLPQNMAAVGECERLAAFERDVSPGEFNLQALV
jgi:hypothetical protein